MAVRPRGDRLGREPRPDRRPRRPRRPWSCTPAGAAFTGEEGVKGILKEGFYGDPAELSEDYFTAVEDDIPHIEAVLTVAGGRIVYATAEEGLDEAVPAVSPAWSPVAHFGGYQATIRPSVTGARQADLMAEAVAESEQHRQWRVARGFAPEDRPPGVRPLLRPLTAPRPTPAPRGPRQVRGGAGSPRPAAAPHRSTDGLRPPRRYACSTPPPQPAEPATARPPWRGAASSRTSAR
ncbi:amidohydrolase family protein [Streptomyces sp. NPDC127040]|uniref:amidohydrolase family protein n=1 Tax=Streptomyces sp. NPDC127040 TaxID=3347116 RepID=UPI00365B58BE